LRDDLREINSLNHYIGMRPLLESDFSEFQWLPLTLGIFALLALRDTSMSWLLYTYAICYGLGQGSRALVLSAISADIFHGKHFGAIFGYFTFSIGLGGAIGAWLGGFLFDVTHSYAVAFWSSLACLIASVFIVWAAAKAVNTHAERN
jgi:MFS family permease